MVLIILYIAFPVAILRKNSNCGPIAFIIFIYRFHYKQRTNLVTQFN